MLSSIDLINRAQVEDWSQPQPTTKIGKALLSLQSKVRKVFDSEATKLTRLANNIALDHKNNKLFSQNDLTAVRTTAEQLRPKSGQWLPYSKKLDRENNALSKVVDAVDKIYPRYVVRQQPALASQPRTLVTDRKHETYEESWDKMAHWTSIKHQLDSMRPN